MQPPAIRFRRDRSGAAAVEFALVLPVLCVALLGTVDGWSYVTNSLSMRAGVKTAANLVLAGSGDDSSTRAAALASWEKKPTDAAVTVNRVYKCGTIVVASASTMCGGSKVPTIFVEIQASGTWSPPFAFGPFPHDTAMGHQQVIRVR
ncbi:MULTISPECIES: TadE/TadG family type IV pilus assembly protein [unclassified Mesorhizobium]|uniref:TadE/TadG family type IV pilus assembly protein n=1 Tax=unclassified Mesorhizobium TaxID=325217 RepID=UPI000F7597DC|nr:MULTISPECIES: TadE/TadG family type IV pilus assembly protein [unclassified Mesorhizobium]AZO06484.1 pilus assembly protein [Mesorhizobium sp. M2A.F.Ca.ET.043.02.1.1]RUW39040.1 pilus assembly protein [Mesorhizobium sp. M2A.F.Ca.ET.015.02.1.1]RUW67969.1 pilus assembly protein [Mesorhizobium sp. M2A.F.Ca.ET.067.02.1.1]RVC97778.1 pilus assembly protein [Mesorhizobium sp. M2A.F.Ca.ET.017.03.2.1]RVD10893.1 pilus assembly protein [Mesorhizobium sp. M2A.F.Ca.ET.029.05.1.1]